MTNPEEKLTELDQRQQAILLHALEALDALQELARPGGPLIDRKATVESLARVANLLARQCMIESEVGRSPFHEDDE
jgi:hypothetical protein